MEAAPHRAAKFAGIPIALAPSRELDVVAEKTTWRYVHGHSRLAHHRRRVSGRPRSWPMHRGRVSATLPYGRATVFCVGVNDSAMGFGTLWSHGVGPNTTGVPDRSTVGGMSDVRHGRAAETTAGFTGADLVEMLAGRKPRVLTSRWGRGWPALGPGAVRSICRT